MSENEPNIKQIVNEIISQPDSAKIFFNLVKSDLKDLQKAMAKSEQVLDLLVQDDSEDKAIYSYLIALFTISNKHIIHFQIVYHILETLLLKSQNQKSLSGHGFGYEQQRMLTEVDRKNLDWLGQYLKHTKGEDDGQ